MHHSCMEFVKKILTSERISGKSVLEVGSYNVNGSPRDWVEPLSPAKYYGIDIQAQDRYVDKVMDASEELGNEIWDVVVSTEMLEHCKDWREAINRMKNAVSDGGLLLVTARGPGKAIHCYPYDYWRFTTSDFEKVFSDFDVIALESDRGEPGVLFAGTKTKRTPPDLSLIQVIDVNKI